MKPSFLAVIVSLFSLPSALGSQNDPLGAIYFMTNDPSGNKIIAADIAANGTLSFGCTADVGGNGGEETPLVPNFPDPLNTQSSITVHRDAGLLLTVNAGSNTVALFSINRRYPSKLTMIGAPVSSYGELPVAVTFNEEASLACVITSGIVNGVGCYTIHPVNGLIPIPNNFRPLGLHQVIPPSQFNETGSQISFSADGSKLIVPVKGGLGNLTKATFTAGFIATFDIDQNGVLSETFKRTDFGAVGGSFPFTLTPIKGHDDIYLSADAAFGYDILDFANGPSEGVAKVISTTIPGQIATCWSTFSAATGNYYMTDLGGFILSELHINDDLTSGLVKQTYLGNNTFPIDIGVARIANNDFLYILVAGGSTGKSPEIWVLALHGPGNAEVVQKWNPSPYAADNGFPLDILYVQGLGVYTKCL